VLGSAALFFAAASWGGTYVASKYVLAYVAPFALVLLRYALASLIFAPALLVTRRHLRRRDLLPVAVAALIGLTLTHSLQFLGTQLSTAHAGALLTSSSPVFMLIFGSLLLHERLTRRRIAALVVAPIGVVVVIGPGDMRGHAGAAVGDVLLTAAGITWALYSVLVRRLASRLPGLVLTAYITLVGAALSVPLGVPQLLEIRALPPAVWLSLLYIGVVSTVIAYYLWNRGMELVEAGSGAVFFFAQPLTGVFFSWLFLHEHLGPTFFAGAALVLAGVALSFTAPRAAAARGAPAGQASAVP
jgi:drug/metabolite transporter (DMT)-like permease